MSTQETPERRTATAYEDGVLLDPTDDQSSIFIPAVIMFGQMMVKPTLDRAGWRQVGGKWRNNGTRGQVLMQTTVERVA